ncbi:hypothetical protein ACJX0J_038667, partial [Zea mays]
GLPFLLGGDGSLMAYGGTGLSGVHRTVSGVHRTVSGVHRTVSGAPTAPRLQRSSAPVMEENQALDN